PYFWDLPYNQSQKLFLDHPDPIHREFLRAGAARVILAVRPGYEDELVSLLDKGELGRLDVGHRFKKILDQVKAKNSEYAAQANVPAPVVPGQPQATPPNTGALIGTWYDYTPTGALDISVVTEPVQTTFDHS